MSNISIHSAQGKPLPSDWKAQAPAKAKAAEADYLARVENAWRGPLNGSREGITARAARLTNDSAARADSGPQSTVRMDGTMRLVGRQDAWEIWRDSVTGATVWKRTK
jgi:hypothetical protein